MQLRKGKTLPERQPPVAKDKGKEKQIEIEEDAIPQQKKNPPMLFKFQETSSPAQHIWRPMHVKRAKGRLDICPATSWAIPSKPISLKLTWGGALRSAHGFDHFPRNRSTTGDYRAQQAPVCHRHKWWCKSEPHLAWFTLCCGFSVNLMTLRTLRSQAIDVQHLAPENNKRLKSAQSTSSWINYLAPEAGQSPVRGEVLHHQCRHVLQYKALLGKPWLHNYYVVPSTIHQCMKYMWDGQE